MHCPPSKSRRSRIHPCTVRQATRPNGATIGALGATAANKGGTEELLQLATEHEATLNHIHVAHLWNKLGKQRGVGQPRHRAAVERLLLRTRSLVGSANARGLANVVHGAAKSAVRGPEATVGLVARPRSSTGRRGGAAAAHQCRGLRARRYRLAAAPRRIQLAPRVFSHSPPPIVPKILAPWPADIGRPRVVALSGVPGPPAPIVLDNSAMQLH